MKSLALACIAIVLLSAGHVAAQQTIDLGPAAAETIEWIAPIILVAGVGLVGWLLTRRASMMGLKINALQRAVVDQGLDRAIGYAISRLGDRARGGIPIVVKNEAIAVAADYAVRAIPGALKHFKKNRDELADMIEARLEGVLVDADKPVSPQLSPMTGRAIER